jgi:O-antigen/teichoic acid export membrane protein
MSTDPSPTRLERLLKRLSDRLGVDVAHYGPHLTWYLIGHAATVVRSLVTSILLAYLLTRDELGQLRYVIAVFGVMNIFGVPGLQGIALLAAAKKQHGTIHDVIRTSVRWSLLGAAALLAWGAYKLFQHDQVVGLSLGLAALLFPLSVYGNFGYPVLQGQEKARTINLLTVVHSLTVALFVILFAWLNTGPLGLTFAVLGTDALFKALLTRHTIRQLEGTERSSALQAFTRVWNRINILQYIAFQLDQLILERAAGYQRLSVYYIATMAPDQFKDLYGNVLNVLLPRLAKSAPTHAYARGLWRNFWKVMALCVMTIILFIFLAPFFMRWLFPKYPDAVLPAQIYMLSFIMFPATILQLYFQSRQLSKPLTRIALFGSVSMIALSATLIPWYGLWGAIIAKSSARLIILLSSMGHFVKEMRELKKEEASR